MSRYNLRNRDSPKDADQDTKSSPRVKKRTPRSPNRSGYSSSNSYLDQSSMYDDDYQDHFSDSQEEDETDYSYPSTTFSPTASTPSPGQHPHRRGNNDSKLDFKTPPSRKTLYPDLSGMSEKTPSPRKENAAHSAERRRTVPVTKETNKNKESTDFTLWVAAAIVLIMCIYFLFPGSSPKSSAKTLAFEKFVSNVDSLQTSFISQEKRTWKSIKSSVKHILNGTDPQYPAVVMFAVRKDLDTVASCLARRVASLFNSVTGSGKEDGYFDARLLSHLEATKQKEDLDEKIQANLKTGRSVVIDHLEALTPTASLLLHGVCDNDNAPFKNVFIGIVFYVERTLRVPDVDTELTNYFSKELDMDKIGALLTRINNNAVVVMGEEGMDSSVCE